MMRIVAETVEGLRGSVDALGAHRLRFFLSVLGIVVGILTVTLMGGAIEGIRQAFRRSVSALYTDVLFLEQYPWFNNAPWWEFRERPPITTEQAAQVKSQLPFAAEVVVEAYARRDAQARGRSADDVSIVGTTEQNPAVRGFMLSAGRFFTWVEASTAARVCVLGADTAETLFPRGGAVGQDVRIGLDEYRVVGVAGRLGQFFGDSLDDRIFMPTSRFAADILAHPPVSVMLKVRDVERIRDARDELRGVMRKVRRLSGSAPDDFAINEQGGALATFRRTNATIAAVGLFITGLSLLVGSIGITNIMYVSVRERTREIGVRKALGARRRGILLQFLIEAVIVCVVGGLVAIGLAYGVGGYLGRYQAIVLSAPVLGVSLAVAAVAGILAGVLPAWEAARLPPVEALRSD